MNPPKKTTHRQTEEQQHAFQAEVSQSNLEFGSVEEMLRHDALHTPVPPAIASRLQESLDQLPPSPRRPWWRRLLGGTSP